MTPLDVFLGGTAASVVIFSLLGAAKAFAPKIVEGREKAVALALGLLIAIGAYLSNPAAFGAGWKGWSAALAAGIAAAIASQQLHDKNPFRKDPPEAKGGP